MPREKKNIGLFGFPLQAQKKQKIKKKKSFSAAAARGSSVFFLSFVSFSFFAGNNFSHPQLIEIADDYHYLLNQIDFDTTENSSKSRGGPRKSEVLDELLILTN